MAQHVYIGRQLVVHEAVRVLVREHGEQQWQCDEEVHRECADTAQQPPAERHGHTAHVTDFYDRAGYEERDAEWQVPAHAHVHCAGAHTPHNDGHHATDDSFHGREELDD